MWSAFVSALKIVAGLVGWGDKTADRKNAPDVKARAVANNDAAADSKAADAIKERNIDELRNDASE